MTDPTSLDPLTYLHDQAHLSIAEIRQAWIWLDLLAEPGRATSPTHDLVDDGRAEALAARGMADQAYRRWNLARGLGALAPAPAPVRLSILDAQVTAAGMVAGALVYIAHVLGTYRGHAGPAPLDDRRRDMAEMLDLLELVVDEVRDADAAARIERQLARANRVARRAAGELGDPVAPLADRCPACRRKSLALHYDPADMPAVADGLDPRHPSLWWVECISRACVCAGDVCPCGRPDEGRRHAWSYGNLGDLWRAADAAAPPRRRIRSTAAGRGWGVIGA